MKLIFAVLDVSLTMGLTRCYKTEGFLHLYEVTKDCISSINNRKLSTYYLRYQVAKLFERPSYLISLTHLYLIVFLSLYARINLHCVQKK